MLLKNWQPRCSKSDIGNFLPTKSENILKWSRITNLTYLHDPIWNCTVNSLLQKTTCWWMNDSDTIVVDGPRYFTIRDVWPSTCYLHQHQNVSPQLFTSGTFPHSSGWVSIATLLQCNPPKMMPIPQLGAKIPLLATLVSDNTDHIHLSIVQNPCYT